MVMREDHCGGVALECGLHNFARVDRSLCERAAKHLVGRDQAMLAVEKQHDEDLVRQLVEQQAEIVTNRLRRRQNAARARFLDQQASRKLDAGLQLRYLRGSDAAISRSALSDCAEHAAKTAMQR